MKVAAIFLFLAWGCVYAQVPAAGQPPAPTVAPPDLPNLPDSEVIAILPDNTKFTMGDVRKYIDAMPPENKANALLNPKGWIENWARMLTLAQLAEKEKLDQNSPTKEQLEFQRLLLLAQTEMQHTSENIVVEGSDITKYYDANKEEFKQVRVSAIYLAFGEKEVKEEQAKAKAEALLAQIRKGADFGKLAHEKSDDADARDKNGYLATVSRTDNLPDALRDAVFHLKEGETSEPVRQSNGYYLLHADKVSYKPLAEVRDQIFSKLKDSRLKEWIAEMGKKSEPQFVNPKFPK